MENANPPYYQPRNSPTPNDILMFKQHEDEPIYDAWARYGDLWGLSVDEAWETIKNCARLAKKLDNPTNVVTDQLIASLREQARRLFWDKPIDEITGCTGWFDFTTIQAEHIGDLDVMQDVAEHDHIDQNDLGFMIDDDESQETDDESFGQFVYSSQNTEDDPYDSDIEVEMPREALEILGKMLGLDYNKTHVEDIGDRDTGNDEVNNIRSLSPPQVLPSFEAHIPPVTYPEEVEETIGAPIEVEPLDQAQLENIGFNTYSDDLFFSSKEVPNFDEPEPQPKPLPKLPSLDVNFGIEIGSDPPINPCSPGSHRIKVVDSKTCREEANRGVKMTLHAYITHLCLITRNIMGLNRVY